LETNASLAPFGRPKKSTKNDAQAALTGGTLRLERALDEKERELQLQRVEIHGLREHLRAVEGARRATPASGDG